MIDDIDSRRVETERKTNLIHTLSTQKRDKNGILTEVMGNFDYILAEYDENDNFIKNIPATKGNIEVII